MTWNCPLCPALAAMAAVDPVGLLEAVSEHLAVCHSAEAERARRIETQRDADRRNYERVGFDPRSMGL